MVDFRVGVVEALPFPDQTFDVVLSSLMLHHLPTDVKRQALREIRRVLKPGGRVVIADFKRPTSTSTRLLPMLLLHGALPEGIQDVPPLLQRAGFDTVPSHDTSFRMFGFALGWVKH